MGDKTGFPRDSHILAITEAKDETTLEITGSLAHAAIGTLQSLHIMVI